MYMEKGVPFNRIKTLIGKIRHAETVVPTGKHLMTPITKILQVKLQIVQWKYFPAAKQVLQDWITLPKEAAREPTTAKELVMGDPKFLGWVHASGEGVGGGWIPGKNALEPRIWRLERPKKLRARLIKPTNPGEGLLLAWLMLEGIVCTKNLHYKHVRLFIDNTAAVLWAQRGEEKNYEAAGRLLRVLSLQQKVERASLLVDAYVAGDLNVIGDIP